MKKEAENSLKNLENDYYDKISAINQLVKALGKNIEKFEAIYAKKDPKEFNSLKKEILQLQRRINELAK